MLLKYIKITLEYDMPINYINFIMDDIERYVKKHCAIDILYDYAGERPDILHIIEAYAYHCFSYYCIHGNLYTIDE